MVHAGTISAWIKSQEQHYHAWQIGQDKSDGETGENPNSLVIIHTSELPCSGTSGREELGNRQEQTPPTQCFIIKLIPRLL